LVGINLEREPVLKRFESASPKKGSREAAKRLLACYPFFCKRNQEVIPAELKNWQGF
jgi:hypothetical protein